jgi:hypothetical protein
MKVFWLILPTVYIFVFLNCIADEFCGRVKVFSNIFLFVVGNFDVEVFKLVGMEVGNCFGRGYIDYVHDFVLLEKGELTGNEFATKNHKKISCSSNDY